MSLLHWSSFRFWCKCFVSNSPLFSFSFIPTFSPWGLTFFVLIDQFHVSVEGLFRHVITFPPAVIIVILRPSSSLCHFFSWRLSTYLLPTRFLLNLLAISPASAIFTPPTYALFSISLSLPSSLSYRPWTAIGRRAPPVPLTPRSYRPRFPSPRLRPAIRIFSLAPLLCWSHFGHPFVLLLTRFPPHSPSPPFFFLHNLPLYNLGFTTRS